MADPGNTVVTVQVLWLYAVCSLVCIALRGDLEDIVPSEAAPVL